MANLGFIGLGVMGGLMTERLMNAGHTVIGFNRTRAKAQGLIDKGMKFSDTPRGVAEAADVVFSMVTNSPYSPRSLLAVLQTLASGA